MEHTPHDRRLLKAARSLYHARERQAILRDRIETAEDSLTAWMLSAGTTQALLGLFELQLEAGELLVTKRDVPDSDQLPLPYLAQAQEPRPAQLGFGLDVADVPVQRVAESDGNTRRLDRLISMSEGEMASLARAFLAVLDQADLAPLMARHEAGVAISHPRDVFGLLAPDMSALTQEQLRVLTLNTRHRIMGNHLVYQGTVSEAPVRVAEVLRPAVIQQAPKIIVAHNHPSGDPSPSPDDHHLTTQLVEGARLMGITILDHVIIAGDTFASCRERGLMPIDAAVRTRVSGRDVALPNAVYPSTDM